MAQMLLALLAWGFHIAAGIDVESMIQHSYKAQDALHPAPLGLYNMMGEEMGKFNLTQEVMTASIDRDLSLIKKQVGLKAMADAVVHEAKQTLEGHEERLKNVWEEFVHRANVSGCETPNELLEQAKAVFLETGALADMQHVVGQSSQALAMLKTSKSPAQTDVFDTFTYDSISVGFDAALAPWSSFTSDIGLPKVKGQGKLFANFKTQYAIHNKSLAIVPDTVRICLSTTADSAHSKIPATDGIKLFGGLSKWKNVVGKSFGVGTVADYKFASDFGWKWTFTSAPELASLYFDLKVIDTTKATSALQTKAEEESAFEEFPIPRGTKFIEQTWCTPMFEYIDPLAPAPTPPPVMVYPASPATTPSPSPVQIAPPAASIPAGFLEAYHVKSGAERCENLIDTKEECQAAQQSLGLHWDGERKWNDRYLGCLVDYDGKKDHVYFNSLGDGDSAMARARGQTALCLSVPASAPKLVDVSFMVSGIEYEMLKEIAQTMSDFEAAIVNGIATSAGVPPANVEVTLERGRRRTDIKIDAIITPPAGVFAGTLQAMVLDAPAAMQTQVVDAIKAAELGAAVTGTVEASGATANLVVETR